MGDRQLTVRLFRDSWNPVWLEPFGMAREIPTQSHGCFLTNMGALLQTAMIGFTGIRVAEAEWNTHEATPAGFTIHTPPALYALTSNR
jgi:hypothetical protein